ncbi:MAG: hypothetical protein CMN30_27260 [Sandaracinus sp.]|nr:hypothetical protein [Sandaracinus sp.]
MIDAVNAGAALVCLGLALGLAGGLELRFRDSGDGAAVVATGSVEDATGTAVPVARYARVASGTTLGDQILDAILEPERLVAVTGESLRSSETPWRHAGRETIEDLADLETLIALAPEVLVVSNVAEARRVARLREAGLRVFDIGSASGVDAVVATAADLGRLVGAPERGEQLGARFRERMNAIADADGPRPGGVYVGAWGNQLFGGAAGTSYHDVLTAAGLRDVAADAGHRGWPRYDTEQLLGMDPDWLVVPAGTAGDLCEREAFAPLRACRSGQVAAIDDRLLGDPGLGMLPAAEALHQRVFGVSSD